MSHSIGIADASFENDDSFEKLKAKHQNLLKDCTCAFNDIVVLQASSDFVETFIYPQLPKITAKEKIVLGELVSSMPLKKYRDSRWYLSYLLSVIIWGVFVKNLK